MNVPRRQISQEEYYTIYQPVQLSNPLEGITDEERDALDAQRERVKKAVLSDPHSIVRALFEEGGPKTA